MATINMTKCMQNAILLRIVMVALDSGTQQHAEFRLGMEVDSALYPVSLVGIASYMFGLCVCLGGGVLLRIMLYSAAIQHGCLVINTHLMCTRQWKWRDESMRIYMHLRRQHISCIQ